jgi:hypothetical protein
MTAPTPMFRRYLLLAIEDAEDAYEKLNSDPFKTYNDYLKLDKIANEIESLQALLNGEVIVCS